VEGSVMVWGLKMPSGFGDYFPEPGAGHVGWRESLTKYFNEAMPAEEKALLLDQPGSAVGSYVYFVSTKFYGEPGRSWGGRPPITPVAEHEWPMWYETKKRYSTIGSLWEMSGQIPAVEEALKDVIERLEPGVHHFHPITVTTRKGDIYPKRYYTMVIGQFLDSFEPAKSAEGSWSKEKDYDSYTAYIDDKKCIEGLALSSASFGSAHLWRERRLRSPDIFLSDILKAEIDKAGLRIPRHYRMKEV
jgi:hypothetical protein